jgi:hypothetical protein
MKQFGIAARQKGMSIISLIFIGLVVVFLMVLGAKLIPALTEYFAIESALNKIKGEPTVPEIRKAFDRFAIIDDIKSVDAKDLDITKDAEQTVISYAYTYSIPIIDNVRLVIDFKGSTKDRRNTAASR